MTEQTRSTGARFLLKELYYSRTLRTVAYAPIDAFEGLTGRRDPLTPPRRLQYVGAPGDFEAAGAYWRHQLVEVRGLRADGDVLDIGCGIGRNAVALIPHLTQGSYEGFDIVPQFIRWCTRRITPRHPNFRFQLADLRNRHYNRHGGTPASRFRFPYPDASFDLAFASSVFTHMEPDGIRRYLSESLRVLRPGGRLVCTFFLLDPVVRDQLAQGRSAFSLDHEFVDAEGTPFLGASAKVPEYCIGVEEADVRRMIGEVGFELDGDVAHGHWSGRPGTEGGDYQDMIVLTRPA